MKKIAIAILILAISTAANAFDLVIPIPDNKVQYVANSYLTVYGTEKKSEETVQEFVKRKVIDEMKKTCLRAETRKGNKTAIDIVATETSEFGVE